MIMYPSPIQETASFLAVTDRETASFLQEMLAPGRPRSDGLEGWISGLVIRYWLFEIVI